MKHRVFVAINLSESARNQLADYQKKIDGLFEAPSPVRWTKKENLHITLEFLGYLSDEAAMSLCQNTQESAQKHRAFAVTLNKICYGPPRKPPRMIWVIGEKIKELNLTPHITLGRIKTWEFRQIEPEERPEINEEISLTFEVNSIEVMESRLKKVGPDYTVLKSCPLQN